MSKQYFTGNYASTHWAVQPYTLDDTKVLTLVWYKDLCYAVYINPTDKRGMRMIIRYVNNADMKSTLNRDYTRDEVKGLYKVAEFVEFAIADKLPNLVLQVFRAGNNSHKPMGGVNQIGHAGEPSFLHVHLIFRGNSNTAYITGIKLCGPAFGCNFDMMGKSPEPGNDKKIPWSREDMLTVSSYFRSVFASAQNGSKLRVITE